MENIFSALIRKSQTDLLLALILFGFVTLILLLFVVKPMYNKLIDVIKGNSTVMAELKALLTNTNENCRTCKAEQITYFKKFEDRQEQTALVLNDIEHHIDNIVEKITGIQQAQQVTKVSPVKTVATKSVVMKKTTT